MDYMFTKIKRKAVVNLKPHQLNKNIDITLRHNIQNDVEGKCMKNGYIRSNSVEISSRSLGKIIQITHNASYISGIIS
jgi:DNA-directed RNA polymerase subunit E'/Rpb7